MANEWVKDLKVGDKVAVRVQGWLGEDPRYEIAEIVGETKAQFRFIRESSSFTERFKKDNLLIIESSSTIHQVNDEILESIELRKAQNRAHNYCKDVKSKFRKLSKAQADEVTNALKQVLMHVKD